MDTTISNTESIIINDDAVDEGWGGQRGGCNYFPEVVDEGGEDKEVDATISIGEVITIS